MGKRDAAFDVALPTPVLTCALDEWRVIPTIDDDYRVVGALHTFF